MSTPQIEARCYTFDMQKMIPVKTNEKTQILDITQDVENAIAESKINEGTVCIFARHTTCALIISEVEDNLEEDLINYFEKEGPKGAFSHTHGGQSHTPSHILSATIGQSLTVPVKGSRMLLGTWQRLCLLEFDGPREREIVIQTQG